MSPRVLVILVLVLSALAIGRIAIDVAIRGVFLGFERAAVPERDGTSRIDALAERQRALRSGEPDAGAEAAVRAMREAFAAMEAAQTAGAPQSPAPATGAPEAEATDSGPRRFHPSDSGSSRRMSAPAPDGPRFIRVDE